MAGLSGDALSDEITAERDGLMTELMASEAQLRAAIEADGAETRAAPANDDDAEGAELRALTARSSAGAIFAAAIEHRATDGATAELQQHYRLSPNQVPLAMLRSMETRAVTPAPAAVGQNQAAIIPGVFPRAVAAFLGVDMPMVPVGEAVYPVLTTNAAAGVPNEGAPQGETTGRFTAEVLSPTRLQASFFYSREDAARFAGMDEALRMNLSDALSDKLDQQVIAGANGLLGAGSPLGAATDATAQASFAVYRGLVYDAAVLDGLYAQQAMDVRVVVGAATYAHAGAQYRSNNADDSAIDSLMRISGGVRISPHVPAPDTNDQLVVISKAPMMRNAVAPLWEG